ncbi:phage tail protein [Streptomyces sp. NPDC002209]|uniref:phage tail protein n=1 Tax=Streptomyces sp. NPDC002209 TaxID=3364638 RepID=UPI0036A0F1A5
MGKENALTTQVTYGQDIVEVKQVTQNSALTISKQAGARLSGEITISRSMDRNTAFTDWVKETVANRNLDSARKNVTITVMDSQKTPVRRIMLSNAWASSWSSPSLEAGGSGPATEQVTITYEDVTVE